MDSEAIMYHLLERMLIDASTKPTDLPLSLLKAITNDFSDDQQIGSGGFATVYKGILQNGMVAVKKLSQMLDVDERKFNQEVDSLMRVKHKNIVRFLGYCSDTQGKVWNYEGKNVMADVRQRLLCFEFLPKGSLDQYITDASQGLEWKARYHIIKGICDGLHYLHTKSILHLDLKPANILLNNNMVPKIADFGLSRCFDEEQSRAVTSKLFGTPGYVAPEFFSREITFKLDIYSLGIIILEILTGQRAAYAVVENVVESWKGRFESSEGGTKLEQVRACAEIGIECINPNPYERPDTKCIIERLAEIECTYGCIGTELCTPSATDTDVSVAVASQLQRIESVPKGSGETSTEVRYMGSSELLDVHPLELRFPFESNKYIECPVTLTNRTDHYVGVWITPASLPFQVSSEGYNSSTWSSYDHLLRSRRYDLRLPLSWEDAFLSFFQMMEPHSTRAVAITMKEQRWRRPPRDTGMFKVLMIVLRSKEHWDKLKASFYGNKQLNMDIYLLKRANELGAEVHQAVLTAVICDPASYQEQEVTLHQCHVAWSIGFLGETRPLLEDVSCIDAHPTETRILVGHIGGYVSIWNYQAEERVLLLQVTNVHTSDSCSVIRSAKFISRQEWFSVGDNNGWVHVYAYPIEDKVKEFEAHPGESISLLAVHSTYPFLLTSSFTDTSIRLWDWDQDWMCIRTFNVPRTGVFHLTWNPSDTINTTFASVSYDKRVKIWETNSSNSDPIIMLEGMESARYLYADSHHHLVVIAGDRETNGDKNACIWDLQSEKCIHRLGFNGSDIYDVTCHPMLPILATSHSSGKVICLWDIRTYRLQKMIRLREGHIQGMILTGTKDLTRIVAKCWAGILIIEVNLPMVSTTELQNAGGN